MTASPTTAPESARTPRESYGRATAFLLGAGIILRLVQFAANRALWLDEAQLALNIIDRNYRQLAQPLDGNQGAPLAFLWLEKTVTLAFGIGEWALRLVPFLAGIAALLLMVRVAREFLGREGVALALALMVTSDWLIYYSSELKPYALDVVVTLLLLWAALRILKVGMTTRNTVIFAALGAIGLWFANPAVFVLAGTGISLGITFICVNDWTSLRRLVAVIVICLASFAGCYWVNLRHIAANTNLVNFWLNERSYMPLPPRSIVDWQWFFTHLESLLEQPAGLTVGAMAFAVLLGCISLWRKWDRLGLLVLPVVVTLLVSSLHKYPFDGRLLLFLSPMVFLAAAEGVLMLRRSATPKTIVTLLLVLMFAFPVLSDARYLFRPRRREEIRRSIAFADQRARPGDTWFIYNNAVPAWLYYTRLLKLNHPDAILQPIYSYDRAQYVRELDSLRGKGRVWILISHPWQYDGISDEAFFTWYLDRTGKRLETYKTVGSSVYLYDMGETRN